MSEQWLSVGDACRALGISRTTLLAAEDAELIAPIRTPGGHRRYAQAELSRYLRSAGPADTSPPLADPPPRALPTWPADPGGEVDELPATLRSALRCLVRAVDGDCAGIYLLRDGTPRFCASFGIPRWLTDRLATTPAPAVVAGAADRRRPALFDPAAASFPEPRATGHGVATALRRAEQTLGVLFLVTRGDHELLAGELRILDATTELIATVVDSSCRIAALQRRLAQIAALSAPTRGPTP